MWRNHPRLQKSAVPFLLMTTVVFCALFVISVVGAQPSEPVAPESEHSLNTKPPTLSGQPEQIPFANDLPPDAVPQAPMDPFTSDLFSGDPFAALEAHRRLMDELFARSFAPFGDQRMGPGFLGPPRMMGPEWAQQEMERLMGQMGPSAGGLGPLAPSLEPNLELGEDGLEWIVTIPMDEELAGSIEVEVDGRQLMVSSSSGSVDEETSQNGVRRQQRWQEMRRVFSLPEAGFAEGTTTNYHDGVLEIRIPRLAGDTI